MRGYPKGQPWKHQTITHVAVASAVPQWSLLPKFPPSWVEQRCGHFFAQHAVEAPLSCARHQGFSVSISRPGSEREAASVGPNVDSNPMGQVVQPLGLTMRRGSG